MAYRNLEFEKIYHTKVQAVFNGLESIRKNNLILIVSATFIGLALAVFGLIIYIDHYNYYSYTDELLILIVISSPLFWYAYYRYNSYRKAYKRQLGEIIINSFGADFKYLPDSGVPSSKYKESRLFLKDYDKYDVEDYVQGKLGETNFYFSELHTQYKTTTTDSKGRTRTQWHTIFKGLFLVANFNKKLTGQTVVLPDLAENLFGNLVGKFFQDKNIQRDQLVKLENVKFEKEFVVYSNSQVESRYILTPDMMERILKLKHKFQKSTFLSFSGDEVIIAISGFFDSFMEPKIFSKNDLESFMELIATLLDVMSIIELLDLNTRIWSKQ